MCCAMLAPHNGLDVVCLRMLNSTRRHAMFGLAVHMSGRVCYFLFKSKNIVKHSNIDNVLLIFNFLFSDLGPPMFMHMEKVKNKKMLVYCFRKLGIAIELLIQVEIDAFFFFFCSSRYKSLQDLFLCCI